ncbi:unnamed protein product [Somion occarium]|uniref:Chromo domain-containing protein n=2 Tax=Somion occarium TaxID=3059160 RepID=A0ABP1CQW2_9APHY
MQVQSSFPNEFQLRRYPEVSLFDFEPPPYNLTPSYTMENIDDSPETIAKVREEVLKKRLKNPFWTWFAPPPIRGMSPSCKSDDYPLEAYMPPPPLPEVHFTQGLVYLQQMNPDGNHEMFIVKWDGKECLLKTFFDDTGLEEDEDDLLNSTMTKFHSEKDAFAHLLHYGACDAGICSSLLWLVPPFCCRYCILG